MDIKRIRNFLTVAEVGSIASAAQVLHIAQPALSAQMKQIEAYTKCQLLSRSSRGVVPTEAGLEFIKRSRQAIEAFEALRTLGGDLASAPSGHVIVGMPVSAGGMLSVPLVTALRRQYPGITLGLLESPSVYLGELLLNGKIDVAVLFDDAHGPGMQGDVQIEEDLFVVGLREAADSVNLRDLKGQAIVMPARPNSVRALLEQACQKKGIALNVVIEVSSPHTMIELVKAGVGVTVLPWSMLHVLRHSGLHASRIANPVLGRTVAVVSAVAKVHSPQLLAVKQLLETLLREQVQAGPRQGVRLKAKTR